MNITPVMGPRLIVSLPHVIDKAEGFESLMSYPGVHPWVLKPREFCKGWSSAGWLNWSIPKELLGFFFLMFPYFPHCLSMPDTLPYMHFSFWWLSYKNVERKIRCLTQIYLDSLAGCKLWHWCPWTGSTGSISPAWGMGDIQSVKASNSHHWESPPALWAAHWEFYTQKKACQQRPNPAPC